jgi:hypothetical protein
MKRIFSVFFALMLVTICFAKTSSYNYDYSIVGVAIAKEGYYLVEVSAIVDKKKDATLDIVKKCAIHGCLFKGFAVDRISQKPMLSSPSIEQKHQEYFIKLFSEQFNNYVNSTQPIQIFKIGKSYRVKAIVVVDKDLLRKDLEEKGIIRKLGL